MTDETFCFVYHFSISSSNVHLSINFPTCYSLKHFMTNLTRKRNFSVEKKRSMFYFFHILLHHIVKEYVIIYARITGKSKSPFPEFVYISNG